MALDCETTNEGVFEIQEIEDVQGTFQEMEE
jgi:hypothetical protein